MANVRISLASSITIDGSSKSISANSNAVVDDLLEFTKDVNSTPYFIATGSGFSFIVVVNIGDADIIVQCGLANETDKVQFSVPVGAHLVLPSTCLAIDNDVRAWAGVKAYTASGTSRMICFVGINAF